ncbi:DUF547 domain-containing protein [Aggregatimonas sangjinii]|uniref:DUF547 domain-containing protein n=1 Tax=Aggregatimonas sangjinii TaxID=2583587 RepID=A0A5B7SJP8_9FLAO|nr:DUF547 domain-containing protein [Aggregatimonas sangjinii]QCW98684.1 DUF547 domain-containing protein [Aggregatimonas sangjinii]
MKNYTITILIFFLTSSIASAQGTSDFFSKTDAFLKANVKNGLVDYKTIHDDPSELDTLLEMAKTITVSTDKAKAYQSFWINAYNLAVIKGVTNNYPLKSPLDVNGFFDKTTYNLGGIAITLNDIENKMLRAKFPKEARFHFVLVCGGLGCPPIIDSAYKPATLEEQLTRQTTKALNNPAFIQVNKNKVKISQIFEWYKGDFEHGGNVVDFINTYKSEKLPEKAKVSYYPYDWTLNEIK